MKGKTTILATLVIAGAAATSFWVVAVPNGGLIETSMIAERVVPVQQENQVSAASNSNQGIPYWTVAQSYYKDGTLDPENGVVHQFGTRVEINGDKATIYGLVDLYYDEVDTEYGVEGVYDDRANTITITGTSYDSEKPVSSFIKIADMYSLSKNEDYTLVLFAGDMYGQQLETIDQLVFNVSDDLSTITSQTGYGAYAFSNQGNPMAFYDYYQPGVEMTKATDDSGLAVSVETLDFNGLFVATNMSVKQTFYVYNRGIEETTFNVSSSSPDLVPSITEGTIGGCSSRSIEVILTPTTAGHFEGSLTISSPALSTALVLKADIEVWEQPDYTKIMKEESSPIAFVMSPVYPFVISEYDGHIAAKSTNNGKGSNTVSYFVCQVDVPQGKTGVFSWNAAQFTSQPNTLTVYLDDEPILYDYYVQTSQAVDMSGIVALSSGAHEVIFAQDIMMDWSEYGDISESYVWNLDFQLLTNSDNLAYLIDESVDFGKTYYDGLTITMEKEVRLLNVGTSPLKVTEVRGSGNFAGVVPSVSVPQGGEIAVPLTWAANSVGTDAGDVVIVTSAGEFTVNCIGVGESLPYDYSQFVTEGTIAFNTGVEWPFKISDNGKYLYNSTSKADIDGITECWLEAIFDVPEGKVGIISWDAINDSEALFVFMNTPSLISGTRFNIDDQYEEIVGGEKVRCGSSNIFTPDKLTFKTGRHSVRFTYKKTSNSEDYIFGDDMLKLFEIGLKLDDIDNHKGDLTSTNVTYSNEVYVGCVGHYPVSLINFTNETPELLSSECDGPFTAKSIGQSGGNLNLMIEFAPTTGGEFENDLTIKTNIGDYTLHCAGTAKESELGTTLFYESFEYDFESYWTFKDGNSDNNDWEILSPYLAAFKYQNLTPYDGNEGLLLKGFDPNDYEYFDTDDYASTPAINIPEDGKTTLRFMAISHSYFDQYLEILVGEGSDATEYAMVKKFTFDSPSAWEAFEVDLSAFAGKSVHIAFRGYDIANYIAIDDVLVASTGSTGVSALTSEKVITGVEYYSIDGQRLSQPGNGVNIVVTRYSDGSMRTSKEVFKQ